MNRLLVLFAMLLLTVPTLAEAIPAHRSTQNQMELNEKACAAYKKADAKMNAIYKKILNDYRKDRLFVQKMRAAQRAWLVFRDAHLESMYPAVDKRAAYGSVQPMCHCMELEKITDERAKVLKQWTDGIEEGDVCGGSIKVK
ncbi:MAG TPA: lysozyme inhibitor LprI family protein [Pyrinomonadaceae bacterium]|nr:lysozyme inhibitor LprI family protein [Pyrinomonadaceae bacterium]